MQHSELLMTLSEIAITMAALSAVAGVVRGDNLSMTSATLLRDVALIGMVVALYCVLPVALSDFGESDVIFWMSLIAAITWIVRYLLYLRGVFKDRSQIRGKFFVGLVITLLGIGLLLTAAIFTDEQATTRYVLGLIALLSIAGLNFVASVFVSEEASSG